MYEFAPQRHEYAHQEGREWKHPLDFYVPTTINPDIRDFITEKVNNLDRYIGRGGAGHVFSLGNGTCIKLIKNRHAEQQKHPEKRYDLGANPRDEAYRQAVVSRLRIPDLDIYTPKVVTYFDGPTTAAIIMEEVPAQNLQLLLQGQEAFPTSFDPERVVDALDDFIDEMHDRCGIVHGDLEPRNILIDRHSGMPRIIDFGRSRVIDKKQQPEAARTYIDADYQAIRNIERIFEAKQLS